MTVFVVETPHRLPARCWVALDELDFVSLVGQSDVGSDLADDATLDDARQALGHDLQSLKVYLSANEAAEGYLAGWDGHQCIEAMAALLDQVVDYEWQISDATLRLRLVGAAWDARRENEREIAGAARDAVTAAIAAGLSEVRIAELLGVTRTTVRRALGK